jgi:hypothetical protein
VTTAGNYVEEKGEKRPGAEGKAKERKDPARPFQWFAK